MLDATLSRLPRHAYAVDATIFFSFDAAAATPPRMLIMPELGIITPVLLLIRQRRDAVYARYADAAIRSAIADTALTRLRYFAVINSIIISYARCCYAAMRRALRRHYAATFDAAFDAAYAIFA